MAGTLAGCAGCDTPGGSSGDIPKDLSGTEVAKLLLANERLNSSALLGANNIFDSGVRVLTSLAETARANLAVYKPTEAEENPYGFEPISVSGLAKPIKYVEYSNSYDAFASITSAIESNAKRGAELIDQVKKNVRVTDKWVNVHNIEYYLHVEENSETLYSRHDGNYIDMCRRYKNGDGKDVYELYTDSGSHRERMLYIPGERFEHSIIINGEHPMEEFFVADNSKGYWQTLNVGVAPEHYNVTCFIMRDDVCCQCFYDPEKMKVKEILAISADRKTDIMRADHPDYYGEETYGFTEEQFRADPTLTKSYDFSLILNGFNGVAEFIPGSPSSIRTANGKTITPDVSTEIPSLRVTSLNVGEFYVNGNEPLELAELRLQFRTRSFELALADLRSFLDAYGLECRRDVDSVFRGIGISLDALDAFAKYYKWNGYSISTEEGIEAAIESEVARLNAEGAAYHAIRNAEKIDFEDSEEYELNIAFAEATVSAGGTLVADSTRITVSGLSISVKDTLLFVEGEPYKVAFALKPIGSGNLVHLESTNETTLPFTRGDGFTVSTAEAELTLPMMTDGEYVLVAYLSTYDGIRSSGFVSVPCDAISEYSLTEGRERMTVGSTNERQLSVKYTETVDVEITVTSSTPFDAEALYGRMAEVAYERWVPTESSLEMQNGEVWSAVVTAKGEALADGYYRISYTADGQSGFVYAEYRTVNANK